jgi:hypothetical protein
MELPAQRIMDQSCPSRFTEPAPARQVRRSEVFDPKTRRAIPAILG